MSATTSEHPDQLLVVRIGRGVGLPATNPCPAEDDISLFDTRITDCNHERNIRSLERAGHDNICHEDVVCDRKASYSANICVRSSGNFHRRYETIIRQF